MILIILGLIAAGYIGYVIGYEMGWDDKSKRKKHRLRK